jgi:uroporphyrin-III C-methyltransferase
MSFPENGKVFLIGAGPGDPELMTLKAARALHLADVVLVDDLVNRGCLAHARSDAKVIEVGKRGGYASTPQVFIEKLMIQYAKAGNTVARLKGGDPFVFGRGGEELQALAAEGIDVGIIPGVTAGLAVPAALGIPVTHRGVASGVTFVTGHTQEGAALGSEPRNDPRIEPNWEALARSGTTLVIYMGLRRLKEICGALMEAGMKPETPACAIENGTLRSQREVVGTLRDLAREVLNQKIASPAIVVIGDVVRFSRVKASLPARRAA